jgi:catechol 2,3-dioxygenase-like lactoylglutathione lyase family enzyme
MPLTAFDHVNIRTGQLDVLIAWYGEVLGLHPGRRPEFGFPGAWLYLDERALVHLVGVEGTPRAGDDLTLEHFAFRATDMPAFLARLKARGIEHSIDPVPGFPIVQVNLRDPDGNHIHVDFDAAEHRG